MSLEWPKTFTELFIAVIMLFAAGAWWIIRWSMKQQSKERNQVVSILSDKQDKIVKTQERIAEILDNHLMEIGEILTKINTAQNIIVDRLLDAALRKPEEEIKE